MKKLFFWKTRVGVFYIAQEGQYYYPLFRDEHYGAFSTPDGAAGDLAGNHTWSLPDQIDSSKLGIPESVSEWLRCGSNDELE
jgi:hypothetical protein